MQEWQFSLLAKQALSFIVETIEHEDKEGLIDVDFQGDIINLTTNLGVYVINRHSAAQEIWLASPCSGPYHFFYIAGAWKTKSNIDLLEILEQELKIPFPRSLQA